MASVPVTAFYTDTVKSRVDGELMEIHFAEGQEVHKGDLLAVIDPRPYEVALAQAQANLARDQAQLADAKLDANRYNELVKSGVIAQQQYDTQAALAGQLTGAVAADQAAIDSAKLNVTYSHITSPIDGRVGLRLVDPGNIVHAADTTGLLVITQMQPIAVIFTLPEDSLPAVNQPHARRSAFAGEGPEPRRRYRTSDGDSAHHRQSNRPNHGDLSPQSGLW